VHIPAEELHFGFVRPFGEHLDFHKELAYLDGKNTRKATFRKERKFSQPSHERIKSFE
jgi:hypothetical protein